jgi:hypothetical protein
MYLFADIFTSAYLTKYVCRATTTPTYLTLSMVVHRPADVLKLDKYVVLPVQLAHLSLSILA